MGSSLLEDDGQRGGNRPCIISQIKYDIRRYLSRTVTVTANSLLFDYYQIGTITFAIKRLKSGVPSP